MVAAIGGLTAAVYGAEPPGLCQEPWADKASLGPEYVHAHICIHMCGQLQLCLHLNMWFYFHFISKEHEAQRG